MSELGMDRISGNYNNRYPIDEQIDRSGLARYPVFCKAPARYLTGCPIGYMAEYIDEYSLSNFIRIRKYLGNVNRREGQTDSRQSLSYLN